MKNFYRKCRLHVWLACLTAGLGLLSCVGVKTKCNKPEESNKPLNTL